MRDVYVGAMSLTVGDVYNVDQFRQSLFQNKSFLSSKEFDFGTFAMSCVSDEILDRFAEFYKLENSFSRFEKMLAGVIKSIETKVHEISLQDIPIFLGTTKGNADLIDENSFHPKHSIHIRSSVKQLNNYLNRNSSINTICHACTSGLMAINVAYRLIKSGAITNALVCGADVVSEFTLKGFTALQAMDEDFCKPFDKNRNGINLGEGAGCIYLTSNPKNSVIKISGCGVANDANHISGPSRTGSGLRLAITSAFSESDRRQIDCVHAHGTATQYNDEMETQAFHRLGFSDIPTHSLKGYFGHTLGAAGILETIASVIMMENDFLCKSLGYANHGVTENLHVISNNIKGPINRCLKTSSGFGGSNAAIILDKVAAI